jgi:hypothetical protein
VTTSDSIAEIIGDYRAFAALQRDRLAARGIDITPYALSHLAYRVADWDVYVHLRTLLERHAKANLENFWNGRPISLIVERLRDERRRHRCGAPPETTDTKPDPEPRVEEESDEGEVPRRVPPILDQLDDDRASARVIVSIVVPVVGGSGSAAHRTLHHVPSRSNQVRAREAAVVGSRSCEVGGPCGARTRDRAIMSRLL